MRVLHPAAPSYPCAKSSPSSALPGRRALLCSSLTLPWLAACAARTPLPLEPAILESREPDRAAIDRFEACADAHGLAAYRKLGDISVAYAGQWRALIDRIQPELVDAGYRGPSEERILPAAGIVAQAYRGPHGAKHVAFRGKGSGAPAVSVWYDGAPAESIAVRQSAALVADTYGLFLLGPLWLAGRPALSPRMAGSVRVDGHDCDVVEVRLVPGLGLAGEDRAALAIDRADRVMRRVTFTLEGFSGTRGAVAEVDTFEHERRFGILWPMRSYERVVAPIRIPAHDWRITGLDVDRGLTAADLLTGMPRFAGQAAAPARSLG